MRISKKFQEEIKENWNNIKYINVINLTISEIDVQFRSKHVQEEWEGGYLKEVWDVQQQEFDRKFFKAGTMFSLSKTPHDFINALRKMKI